MVHVLLGGYAFEGRDIIAIYHSKDIAETEMQMRTVELKVLNAGTSYYYDIEEHEVQ